MAISTRPADITYLRERAEQFRALAHQHAEADNAMVATKLSQVAAELEAKAASLAPTLTRV